jgi:putative ABC transport system ATP-binding protein
VLELLARLHAERGVAVVVVTHDQGVAARFRRRVTLRDGRLAGDPDREGVPR